MPDAQGAVRGTVTVVGTGTWGTTLAILGARQGLVVRLLARTEEEAERLAAERENKRFLPGHEFPPDLTPTADPAAAVEGSDAVFMVVPSQTMRANIGALKPYLRLNDQIVVSASKGLDSGSKYRMTQVIVEELGGEWASQVAALSGPNLAKEIVLGLP